MAKSANPLPDVVNELLLPLLLSFSDANGSEFVFKNGSGVGVGDGVGGAGAARKFGAAVGRGGAGLGGGCLAFFGGNAGLGLSARVGACKFANGSSPNASLDWKIILFYLIRQIKKIYKQLKN